MFADTSSKRTVVFIGEGSTPRQPTGRASAKSSRSLPERAPDRGAGVLRARLRGAPLNDHETAAREAQRHPLGAAARARATAACRAGNRRRQALAFRCLAKMQGGASYGVMVWAPPGLNFPHADLAVHLISEIVKEINVTTRFAGLSLGGNEGAPTAAAVATWQSGFPLARQLRNRQARVRFLPLLDRPHARRERGRSSFLAHLPLARPRAARDRIPTIVLGHARHQAEPAAERLHSGRHARASTMPDVVRCDNVVSLPLKNLGRSRLPRAADVLAKIETAL